MKLRNILIYYISIKLFHFGCERSIHISKEKGKIKKNKETCTIDNLLRIEMIYCKNGECLVALVVFKIIGRKVPQELSFKSHS